MNFNVFKRREVHEMVDNDAFRACKCHNLQDAHIQSCSQVNISTACVVSKIGT